MRPPTWQPAGSGSPSVAVVCGSSCRQHLEDGLAFGAQATSAFDTECVHGTPGSCRVLLLFVRRCKLTGEAWHGRSPWHAACCHRVPPGHSNKQVWDGGRAPPPHIQVGFCCLPPGLSPSRSGAWPKLPHISLAPGTSSRLFNELTDNISELGMHSLANRPCHAKKGVDAFSIKDITTLLNSLGSDIPAAACWPGQT